MCLCSLISLLRIPRLITVQNKEDFSALISKVSSTMKVTLEINYLLLFKFAVNMNCIIRFIVLLCSKIVCNIGVLKNYVAEIKLEIT